MGAYRETPYLSRLQSQANRGGAVMTRWKVETRVNETTITSYVSSLAIAYLAISHAIGKRYTHIITKVSS
jgi:hypothetical protein